jgi:hypothetical protein
LKTASRTLSVAAKTTALCPETLCAIALSKDSAMTLVVSDISKHGIVMVGDSAVTKKRSGVVVGVVAGAVKVQYCSAANIGVAMWGYGQVDGTPLDKWVSEFLQNSVSARDDIVSIGTRLADSINRHHSATGKPWKELVCGFHLGGYLNGLPQLYHVHCGHAHEPSHELRLYKDFPNDQGWTESEFRDYLNTAFIHLRNGYHPLFAPLFDNILKYAQELKTSLSITFPQNSLQGRLRFYQELVKFVAGVLEASGVHQGVNDTLSSIGFDNTGIIFDERLPLAPATTATTGTLDFYTQSDGSGNGT